MRNLLVRAIQVARRYLFHTRIGRSRLVASVYAWVFDLWAPDLTEPITFRGVPLYVDPDDRACVPSMVGGYFEELELSIFERLIPSASMFLDVGANIGTYTVIGGTKAPGLKIHAFEPVAENQQLLERNVALNHLEGRVTIVRAAVSERTGTARIYLHQSNTHSLENYESADSREIDTVSLDERFAGEDIAPAIVKIDVEGHEAAVLAGAWKMLSGLRPTMFVEYAPVAHRDVGAMIGKLRSLYRTAFAIDEISKSVTEIDLNALDEWKILNLVLTADPEHEAAIRSFVEREA